MHSITVLRFIIVMLVITPYTAHACWVPADEHGTLTFRIDQPQGPPVIGEFVSFDGYICPGPDHTVPARLFLRVDTASVETGLPELNDALRSTTFFETDRWPHATFESRSITATNDDSVYRVKGAFTLRDVTKTIEVSFTFRRDRENGSATLVGSHTIKRLDYGVGQGKWGSTEWAADEVKLEFNISLVKSKEEPAE